MQVSDCAGGGLGDAPGACTAVFSGMLGLTFLGIFLTPVFFSLIMKFFGRKFSGEVGHAAKPRNCSKKVSN
jgi:hypothetical protein